MSAPLTKFHVARILWAHGRGTPGVIGPIEEGITAELNAAIDAATPPRTLTDAEREAIREAALLLDEAEANEVKERHRTAIADTAATLRALLDRAATAPATSQEDAALARIGALQVLERGVRARALFFAGYYRPAVEITDALLARARALAGGEG